MLINESHFTQKWSIVNLDEVVEFLDSQRKPITEKDRISGTYPYYGANGQQDLINDYIFDEPLVLLAEDGGHFGEPNRTIAYQINGKCWVNNHAHVLRPKNNINIRYLCRVLEHYDVSKYITGSTRAKLTKTSASQIKIPLPPIASQRRIANILDKADEIIRKRKEAIALTEQLQKSIFLDMFGDPVINPKGWEVEELNNVISIISGQVDPKVEPFIDMPHIGGENLQSNTNNIQNIKTPRELKLKSGKYLFQSGDVLYSKIRPYLNQVVIPDFSGVCSADIYPLRVIETKIKNDFLIYLLRSKFFLDYAEKHSTRTNIPKINRPTLLSFRFPCPPINIQKDFSDKYNKITQIQKNFNHYLTESENLFNSLLQKAFKGEL
jgi:type I restriction enzyme S subunit